jgi:hypothetical protein
MPATEYTAGLIADALANGTAYQGPSSVKLALVTTLPTPTEAGTEVTLGGYERVTFAQSGWTNNGVGGLTNTAEIVWPEATAEYDGPVVAVEAYNTAGTYRLWYVVLSQEKTVIEGLIPKFLAGDLVLTVT